MPTPIHLEFANVISQRSNTIQIKINIFYVFTINNNMMKFKSSKII